MNCCLDLNFDVLHAATGNRYADANDIRLANLGPLSLLSSYELTTSSGKKLEDISHAHIFSSMYKLINSARDTDDLSIGFERDGGKRQRELTHNKIVKGKFHERILLKDVFGFAVHQEKATYGLRHKITLTRKTDNAVLNKDNATNVGEIEVIAFDWYIPHYMPSISIQDVLFKPNLSKTPTKLQYVKKSFF